MPLRSIRFAPFRVCVVLFGALFLTACVNSPLQYETLMTTDHPYQKPVELGETPFFPQEDYQCGPAALATVLQVSGVDSADPEQLTAQVYLPERRGSLQAELLAATRRADRIPYVLAPSLDDLLTELYGGNPVLVLQNLAHPRWPVWHYAVVIGYDPLQDEVILRSGTIERETMTLHRFERTWQLADYWALVVTPPGDIPLTAKPLDYFAAIAPLEQQQRFEAATASYQAAAQRWPDEATSHLALGNIAYQQTRYHDAELYYYDAIERAPEQAATYYNLAWALLRQDKHESALQAAAQAAELAPEHPRYKDAPATLQQAINQ